MLKKVIAIFCLLVMGCGMSIAFADAPDPERRYSRPLQHEETMRYYIRRVEYHALDEYEENKVAVDILYHAPVMSKISFVVEAEDGTEFYSGEEVCANKRGYFTVYMPRPLDSRPVAKLKTECRLRHIETKFGFKEVDYDVFSDSEERTLCIEK